MKIVTFLVVVCLPLAAQTNRVNAGVNVLGPFDATNSPSSKPNRGGTLAGLPATCTTGETYFASDVPALEFCVAPNSWRQFAWNGSLSPAADAPTFLPVGGTYAGTRNVTMSSTTAGAAICFTTDGTSIVVTTVGSCPTGSTLYVSPVAVSVTTIVKAVATKAGFTPSPETSATYTITGGAGSPALVSHTSAAGNTTSPLIDTTGATSLVVGVSAYQVDSAGAGIVTDSNGNVWVAGTRYGSTASYNSTLWYVLSSPIVGTNHSFTVTTASPYVNFYPMALSGTTTLDQHNGNSLAGSTPPFLAGAVTPTADNEVVITLLGIGWGGGWTPVVASAGNAWNVTDHRTLTLVQGAMAYQIQTTATTVNPSWTGASWTATPATGATITLKSN